VANLLGGITGFFDKYILGFALGTAAGPSLEPFVQHLANDAWELNQVVPPEVYVLAEGVAQGQVNKSDALDWAHKQGIGDKAFNALVDIANVGPPLGLAYEAWRRGQLTEAEFQTALRRLGIEDAWFDALKALKHDRLDLGAVATAVHRGVMDDAGLLVQQVPTGPGNVPRIPVSSLDTLAEFAAQGIDPERARVLVADTGLPLSLGEMLSLYNRNKVTATDVKVSIAESNVRNEYMNVALDLARRLLTPHEYAEAELRGVKTRAEAQSGANLSGVTDADYVTIFENLGRPLNVHEITTALARGGTYGGDYSTVPQPYRDAIRRSAIRPEYADLAFHNRFTYPSAFVLRSLAQAGDLGDRAAIQNVLEEIGWKPSFARQVSTAWTTGGGTADPHVTKAQNQLWTRAHSSFVGEMIDGPTATSAIEAAGVSAATSPAVLALWTHERSLIRKQLTPAQVKKAFKDGLYTRQQAIDELLARGYDQADAVTLLDE
jgi:hypothetical protein